MNVVFLMNEYSLHNHILRSYVRARPEDAVSVVKVPLVVKGKSRVDTGKKILPQLSPRFVVEKLYEFLLLGAITWSPKVLRRGEDFRRLRWIANDHRLPFFETDSVTSKEALNFIRERSPDVIVTLMHQIVKGELLTLGKRGIVNIHPGLLPAFRGIQPYFWALSKGAGRTGATLHLIEDEGVDTGGILASASFQIPQRSSVSLAYYLTARSAGHILPGVLEALCKGELEPLKQNANDGAFYRWPDRAAFQGLWREGHALVRTKDIFAIIFGRCDGFAPDEVLIHRRESS